MLRGSLLQWLALLVNLARLDVCLELATLILLVPCDLAVVASRVCLALRLSLALGVLTLLALALESSDLHRIVCNNVESPSTAGDGEVEDLSASSFIGAEPAGVELKALSDLDVLHASHEDAVLDIHDQGLASLLFVAPNVPLERLNLWGEVCVRVLPELPVKDAMEHGSVPDTDIRLVLPYHSPPSFCAVARFHVLDEPAGVIRGEHYQHIAQLSGCDLGGLIHISTPDALVPHALRVAEQLGHVVVSSAREGVEDEAELSPLLPSTREVLRLAQRPSVHGLGTEGLLELLLGSLLLLNALQRDAMSFSLSSSFSQRECLLRLACFHLYDLLRQLGDLLSRHRELRMHRRRDESGAITTKAIATSPLSRAKSAAQTRTAERPVNLRAALLPSEYANARE